MALNWDDYFTIEINVPDADILNEIRRVKNVEFEPGSDYLYSNSNPFLPIKIVEHIAQSSFNYYLQENIVSLGPDK